MAVSFGDFKPDEIYRLIENKDPLGLNNDTEGHSTLNKNQLKFEESEKKHGI